MENRLIITIDGPSAAGKSTLANLLAQSLNYLYIDTGAMYRAIAWKVLKSGINPRDEEEVVKLTKRSQISFRWNGEEFRLFFAEKDISNQIRDERIGEVASMISVIPEVRKRMVALQREMCKGGGVVLEGRDTGTVVCPFADVKFYLDASTRERGKRRYLEIKDKSMPKDLESTIKEIKRRDLRDTRRKHSPLKKAVDAIYIDSTSLTIEEVLQIMLKKAKELLHSR